MNGALSQYARSELVKGLDRLPEDSRRIFRLMYGHLLPENSIEAVVKGMPDEKLDWAMKQVHRSLLKDGQAGIEGLSDDD